MRSEKSSGLSNAVTDPVTLTVSSRNVAGLSEESTDIFLSQISMLTNWDVLLLQACFRKLDGVNVGAHELFTPCELVGGLPLSSSHHASETEEQADGLYR